MSLKCVFAVSLLLNFASVPALQAQVLPKAVTPALPGIVAGGILIERLGTGFEGTEGPLGLPDGSLLFTETRAERIVRVEPNGAHATFLEHTNGANALALAPDGALVAVQVLQPRVGIVHPAARAKTLADGYEGKPFTRPNDLVLASGGRLYFTDSRQSEDPAAAGPAVYALAPDGELTQIATTLGRPNGIQLSTDERTLYVADTLGGHIVAFALDAKGSAGARRDFAALAGWDAAAGSSGADGLAVDAAGRLYAATNAGIEIFAADGEALGIIPLPVKAQNLAFAGPGKRWLYVVGRGELYRFPVLTSGYEGRAK